MSLFDVIRYPVSGFDDPIIYDVPDDIVIPWIEECYEILSTTCGTDYNLYPKVAFTYTVDTVPIINALRMHTMISVIRLGNIIEPGIIEYTERYFIQLLKDRIKEYNL